MSGKLDKHCCSYMLIIGLVNDQLIINGNDTWLTRDCCRPKPKVPSSISAGSKDFP